MRKQIRIQDWHEVKSTFCYQSMWFWYIWNIKMFSFNFTPRKTSMDEIHYLNFPWITERKVNCIALLSHTTQSIFFRVYTLYCIRHMHISSVWTLFLMDDFYYHNFWRDTLKNIEKRWLCFFYGKQLRFVKNYSLNVTEFLDFIFS